MDRYDIAYAREHLDELIERARRGEQVTIADPVHGAIKLVPAAAVGTPDGDVVFGQWRHLVEIPDVRLLAPLSQEELDWLSGEASPVEPAAS